MKKEFKPIAMKCNQEQFNAIRPILEANGGKIELITPFERMPYLINNREGIQMRISNITETVAGLNERSVLHQWNQDIFLEFCGIEVKPKFKPIAMKCNQEQFDAIRPILEAKDARMYDIGPFNQSFNQLPYLVNNLDNDQGLIANVSEHRKDENGRTVFEEWNQDIFLEYCGIKTEKQTEKTMGYKLTIPATEVLAIHKIACSTWKRIISNYLTRVDSEQNITFTEKEIDDMFEAATSDQKKILKAIFGEKKKEIDFDKLKTGSKVIIKYSGYHCGGIGNIDRDEPVDIVFYKTPHFISGATGKFTKEGHCDQYITFHQNGKFVLFAADEEIDYITEVIEY